MTPRGKAVRAYRFLALLFVALVATAVAPSVASAEPYPAGEPAASVSTGTTTEGGSVTFSGSGFEPGETITITVDGVVVATVTASSDGTFSVRLKLSSVGTANLVATGESSGVTASSTVTVKAKTVSKAGSDDESDGLPTTGMSARRMVIAVSVGTAALIVGASLIWLSYVRRRRRTIDA
jgi:antitoxin (DNA-binding transcriptional repressor) of toxin-antitoxin stability system